MPLQESAFARAYTLRRRAFVCLPICLLVESISQLAFLSRRRYTRAFALGENITYRRTICHHEELIFPRHIIAECHFAWETGEVNGHVLHCNNTPLLIIYRHWHVAWMRPSGSLPELPCAQGVRVENDVTITGSIDIFTEYVRSVILPLRDSVFFLDISLMLIMIWRCHQRVASLQSNDIASLRSFSGQNIITYSVEYRTWCDIWVTGYTIIISRCSLCEQGIMILDDQRQCAPTFIASEGIDANIRFVYSNYTITRRSPANAQSTPLSAEVKSELSSTGDGSSGRRLGISWRIYIFILESPVRPIRMRQISHEIWWLFSCFKDAHFLVICVVWKRCAILMILAERRREKLIS